MVYSDVADVELYHFILPLRAHYLTVQELKPIVLLLGNEYVGECVVWCGLCACVVCVCVMCVCMWWDVCVHMWCVCVCGVCMYIYEYNTLMGTHTSCIRFYSTLSLKDLQTVS